MHHAIEPFLNSNLLSFCCILVQVGSEVARRARGLGMTIIAHDPFASEAKAAAIGVRLVTLNEALAQGDFFSLHMPLTGQTKVCNMLHPLYKGRKDYAFRHSFKKSPRRRYIALCTFFTISRLLLVTLRQGSMSCAHMPSDSHMCIHTCLHTFLTIQ